MQDLSALGDATTFAAAAADRDTWHQVSLAGDGRPGPVCMDGSPATVLARFASAPSGRLKVISLGGGAVFDAFSASLLNLCGNTGFGAVAARTLFDTPSFRARACTFSFAALLGGGAGNGEPAESELDSAADSGDVAPLASPFYLRQLADRSAHVLVFPNCSGDVGLGANPLYEQTSLDIAPLLAQPRRAPQAVRARMPAQGAEITVTGLTQLLATLAEANQTPTEVQVMGVSAGSIRSLFLGGLVARLLPNTPVRVLMDSGILLDHDALPRGTLRAWNRAWGLFASLDAQVQGLSLGTLPSAMAQGASALDIVEAFVESPKLANVRFAFLSPCVDATMRVFYALEGRVKITIEFQESNAFSLIVALRGEGGRFTEHLRATYAGTSIELALSQLNLGAFVDGRDERSRAERLSAAMLGDPSVYGQSLESFRRRLRNRVHTYFVGASGPQQHGYVNKANMPNVAEEGVSLDTWTDTFLLGGEVSAHVGSCQ